MMQRVTRWATTSPLTNYSRCTSVWPMSREWRFHTWAGTFRIVERPGTTGRPSRYHAMLGSEDLGSYHSPESALGDLLGGHTDPPSSGVETDEWGLPDELSDWELVTRGGR